MAGGMIREAAEAAAGAGGSERRGSGGAGRRTPQKWRMASPPKMNWEDFVPWSYADTL
jgi:hypothetical protein